MDIVSILWEAISRVPAMEVQLVSALKVPKDRPQRSLSSKKFNNSSHEPILSDKVYRAGIAIKFSAAPAPVQTAAALTSKLSYISRCIMNNKF